MATYKALGINNGAGKLSAYGIKALIIGTIQLHRQALRTIQEADRFTVFQVEQIENGRVIDRFNIEASVSRIFRGHDNLRQYGYGSERK